MFEYSALERSGNGDLSVVFYFRPVTYNPPKNSRKNASKMDKNGLSQKRLASNVNSLDVKVDWKRGFGDGNGVLDRYISFSISNLQSAKKQPRKRLRN